MALTGELYEAVVKIVDERVREIRVTREMYDKLVEGLDRLAESHKLAMERLDRVESVIEKLAEAQKRTEVSVAGLSFAVGRLTDTIGHDLDSIARVSLPDWLKLHAGVKVASLQRRIFTVDGEEVEVNLFGEGVRRGHPISVVGEAKSTIHGRDVAAFSVAVSRIEKQLGRTVVKLLFGYWIHPSAEPEAKRLGIHVIAPPSSYPRPKPTKRKGKGSKQTL